MSRKISSNVINFHCEFILHEIFCASTKVVFGIPSQVVFHPSMDEDGPSIWVCVFLNLLNCLHHRLLEPLFFLLVNDTLCFYWLFILEHLFFNTLLLEVKLTSTTFTFAMTIYVLTTGWTFVIVKDFPWNIFCILANFGQSVILWPFKP